jgi:5-methylcytosine-specific restriction endonuclease McrA
MAIPKSTTPAHQRELNAERNVRYRARHRAVIRARANARTAAARVARLAARALAPAPTTKRCAACHTAKAFAAFGVCRRRKDGLHSYCKACRAHKNATLSPASRARKHAAQRRYELAHLAEVRAKGEAHRRRRCAEHPELVKADRKRWKAQWAQRNPERARAGEKRRRDRVSPATKHAYATKWRADNPERSRLLGRKKELTRRAVKKAAFIEVVDPQVVYRRANGVCGICRVPLIDGEKWHVDHIIPLARGGVHAYSNVQLAHALCNIKKGASAA